MSGFAEAAATAEKVVEAVARVEPMAATKRVTRRLASLPKTA